MQEILKSEAKQTVDGLFDDRHFARKVTRGHMHSIEDVIDTSMQMRFESVMNYRDLVEAINGED